MMCLGVGDCEMYDVCRQWCTQVYTHTHAHTRIRTHARAHTHTHTHTHTKTIKPKGDITQLTADPHPPTHTTHPHTHTHTHLHTHTHTHTYIPCSKRSSVIYSRLASLGPVGILMVAANPPSHGWSAIQPSLTGTQSVRHTHTAPLTSKYSACIYIPLQCNDKDISIFR